MSFALSKLLWGLAAPGNLLLLAVAAGVVLLALGRRRAGLWLAGSALVLMLAAAVLPVGAWMARPLEARFPPGELPARVDGIVVLGGAIDPLASAESGRPELNAAADRLLALAWLAGRHPEARLVFTGGSGRLLDQHLPEAPVAAEALRRMGLDPDRLTLEGESRNTWENAVLAHRLAAPREGEVWLLVTSAMHMPRSVGCFRKAGWTVVPWPVDLRVPAAEARRLDFDLSGGLDRINAAAREYLGLLAYRLMGRTDALLPGP